MRSSTEPVEGPRTERADVAPAGPARLEIDPENTAKGLGQLVLTVVELLRELMERQAIHRMELGSLDEEQIEQLGRALQGLDENMDVLVDAFGLTRDDLNLDLGPLGTLL
ncbi:MAG: gas vesicle protein K [Ilumatobacter sp.]|nr:gas vesicle protein K [Ilumatobacter sp.]